MIEIQCTSCHTRYRIDERVLPDDTPTFKCSRCGHVFTAEPVRPRARKAAPPSTSAEPSAIQPDANPSRRAFDDVAAASPPKKVEVEQPEPELPDEPEPEVEAAAPIEHEAAPSVPEADPPAAAASAVEPPPEVRRPSTDEIFNKSFAEPAPRPDTGENLKFDFADERRELDEEPEPEVPAKDEGWQVGEAPEIEPTSLRARPALDIDLDASSPQPSRPEAPQKFYQPLDSTSTREPAGPRPYIPDDVAFIEDTSPVHSSGWFLAMFFLVAAAFFGLSMMINGAPSASVSAIGRMPVIGAHFARPLTPAMLVKLGDVRTEYRTLKGGKSALVVTGNAENMGAQTLHAIAIEVLLLNGSQRSLARAQTYCGNALAAGMFDEMTPRELEFSLGLKPPKNFALDPSQATPFMLVFLDPPPLANSLRIAVTQADPVIVEGAPHS